jgi:DNA mismatch repair protein MutL
MLTQEKARIKLLSPDLASKIAAGEVVERPASVLKELLENSIDAGATHIDINIERGGIQSIKIRDNGNGILREDLELALQQHATSKISTSQDLESIYSLGFRGEALASINSVARLSITSNTLDQDHAWCISNGEISAAAHPVGTTVYMRDLFYNIPARRKFLRSERTEYQYIEEVFRRIALSNFDVAFSLTNQGKLVKSLPICKDQISRTRRVINLCGQQVLNQAITIDAEQNGLKIWGWLGSVQLARSQEPHQYFFINKRVIRDRLINHAIRQVYQPLCYDGKMPFYCLYLELDPIALDVNVHPTKHEVRFRDARVIHAFLTQIISQALGTTAAVAQDNNQTGSFANNVYSRVHENTATYNLQDKILSILGNKLLIAQRQDKIILLDITALRKKALLQQLSYDRGTINLESPTTLQINQSINFNSEFATWCLELGFGIDSMGPQTLIVRSVPRCLQAVNFDFKVLVPQLFDLWKTQAPVGECNQVIIDSVNHATTVTESQALRWLEGLSDTASKGLWRELNVDQLHELL